MKCSFSIWFVGFAGVIFPGMASAQPLLVDGSVECYQKGFAPEQAKVALDGPTRALFLSTPCGWQFFRVISADEVASLYKVARPITVPQSVMTHTLAQLNELRVAKLHVQDKAQ